MLPVLLDLKLFKIYTFGVFLVLSFFWGCFILWKNIRLTSNKEEDIFDGVFLSLAGSLLVGRLVYVLLNLNKFGFDPIKFILINGYPGISLYGSIFGGWLVLITFFYYKKIKVLSTLDYFISPFFLSLAFGKLGSFFSGTEIGTKTKFILAIKYVGFDGFRHITPFYEALIFFVGAYISFRLIFEIRKGHYSQGFLFIFFIWFFSLTYFVFDKFMDNPLYFLGYRFNQITSLILLLTSTVYLVYYFRSLIIGRTVAISSYVLKYGQKTFQSIYRRNKRKTREGENKNSPAS